ncbi:MAG: DnaJ domain-containing protein [Nitrososphaeria archaeon]
MIEENYYQMLGISQNATQDDIEKAYRNLIARYHPDKFQSMGQEVVELAREKCEKINNAYETLKDPEKRKAYDEVLKSKSNYWSQTANSEPNKYEGRSAYRSNINFNQVDVRIKFFELLKTSLYLFIVAILKFVVQLFRQIWQVAISYLKIIFYPIQFLIYLLYPAFVGFFSILTLNFLSFILGMLIGIPGILLSIVYIAIVLGVLPTLLLVLLLSILFRSLEFTINDTVNSIYLVDLLLEKDGENFWYVKNFKNVKNTIKFSLFFFLSLSSLIIVSLLILLTLVFFNRYILFLSKIPSNLIVFNTISAGGFNIKYWFLLLFNYILSLTFVSGDPAQFVKSLQFVLPDFFKPSFLIGFFSSLVSIFQDGFYLSKNKLVFKTSLILTFIIILGLFLVQNLKRFRFKQVSFKSLVLFMIILVTAFGAVSVFANSVNIVTPKPKVSDQFVGFYKDNYYKNVYFWITENSVMFTTAPLSGVIPNIFSPYSIKYVKGKYYVCLPFPVNFVKIASIKFNNSSGTRIIVEPFGLSNLWGLINIKYNADKVSINSLPFKLVFKPDANYFTKDGERVYQKYPNFVSNGFLFIDVEKFVESVGGTFDKIGKYEYVVKINGKTIRLKDNDNVAKIDGSSSVLIQSNKSISAINRNGILYVPIRFFINIFNYEFEWNDKKHILIVWVKS